MLALSSCCGAVGCTHGRAGRFAFERQRPFAEPPLRAAWAQMQQPARARVPASAVPAFACALRFRLPHLAPRNRIKV